MMQHSDSLADTQTEQRARASAGASDDAIYLAVAREINRRLESAAPVGGTLLDVGCGSGRLHVRLSRPFARRIGVDVVRYEGLPDAVNEFIGVDLDSPRWPIADETADVTVSVETIEHLENPRAFFRELVRITRPGGVVIVSTPNQASLLSKLTLLFKNQFNAFQERPGLYPAHRTALLPIDLARIARESGLVQVSIVYTESGRIPGTRLRWPGLGRVLPRGFSDNVICSAVRPPAGGSSRDVAASVADAPAEVAARNAPPAAVRIARRVIRRLPAGRYRMMNWVSERVVNRAVSHDGTSSRFVVDRGVDGAMSFTCDLRDSICREVCFTGQYEPLESAVVRSILRPGDTFVDVGANWGYFTLLGAHRIGTAGRVIAFEPDPRLYPMLEANLRLNALTQVLAERVAVADRAGSMSLVGYDAAAGNWGLSRLSDGTEAYHGRFNVETEPLDDALSRRGVDRVRLVKMDIEGAERLAVQGMRGGLAQGRYDSVLLELHPGLITEQGGDVSAVIEAFQGAGYIGWTLDHSPAASRRIAYERAPKLREYLRPMSDSEPWSAWPHVLWVRPGASLPDVFGGEGSGNRDWPPGSSER